MIPRDVTCWYCKHERHERCPWPRTCACWVCYPKETRVMLLSDKLEALKAAIAEGKISHSRQKSWCREEIVYVYERARESPTGVRLFLDFPGDTPGLDQILRGGLSPLSPTEGR